MSYNPTIQNHFKTPESELMFRRTKKLIVTVSTLDNPEFQYEGFLIGEDLVLTTSRINQHKRFSTYIVMLKRDKNYNPITHKIRAHRVTQMMLKGNYTLVLKLAISVLRRRYMCVATDYSPIKTYFYLQNQENSGIELLYYQAGDHLTILPNQIRFFANRNQFILAKMLEKNTIKAGTPLLVVFNNRQCFAIGIFVSHQYGVIFQDKLYISMWRYLYRKFGFRVDQITTRLIQWYDVNLSQVYPPYTKTNLYCMNYDSEPEYHPPGTEIDFEDFQKIRTFCHASALRKKNKDTKNRTKIVLDLSKKYFGEFNDMKNNELFFRLINNLKHYPTYLKIARLIITPLPPKSISNILVYLKVAIIEKIQFYNVKRVNNQETKVKQHNFWKIVQIFSFENIERKIKDQFPVLFLQYQYFHVIWALASSQMSTISHQSCNFSPSLITVFLHFVEVLSFFLLHNILKNI